MAKNVDCMQFTAIGSVYRESLYDATLKLHDQDFAFMPWRMTLKLIKHKKKGMDKFNDNKIVIARKQIQG